MTGNPNALAETYIAAWKAKDFKTLRSSLADDATFNGPAAPGSRQGCALI